MPVSKKKNESYATIDVSLIVIRTSSMEIAIDTSNKLGIEPQVETQEAIKLIKDGRVISQKPERKVLTGHKLVLTDTVFSPQLAKIMSGGEVTGTGDSLKYTPPVSGSSDRGEVFEVDAYSACYTAGGLITNYEKTTYPNCQGSILPETIEDNVFRVSEYEIFSAPNVGQAPYDRSLVKALPDFHEAAAAVFSLSENEEAIVVDNEGTTAPAVM